MNYLNTPEEVYTHIKKCGFDADEFEITTEAPKLFGGAAIKPRRDGKFDLYLKFPAPERAVNHELGHADLLKRHSYAHQILGLIGLPGEYITHYLNGYFFEGKHRARGTLVTTGLLSTSLIFVIHPLLPPALLSSLLVYMANEAHAELSGRKIGRRGG